MSTILILGGTTEGKIALEVCEEAGRAYYYSTRFSSQEVSLQYGIRLSGAMDRDALHSYCVNHDIGLIIDATHPFATNLHTNIGTLDAPIIRYERVFPKVPQGAIVVDGFETAISQLQKLNPAITLAFTGVNSIEKLKLYWQSYKTYFRVMPLEESRSIVKRSKIDADQIIYYDESKTTEEIIRELNPNALIIKESGETAGFSEKVQTAIKMGVKVIVVACPPLGYSPKCVATGKVSLRLAIEKLLPGFFDHRIGLTTGVTATAASKAALLALLNEEAYDEVLVTLPSGEMVPFPIKSTQIDGLSATSVAVKNGGDDPDVTHGAEIHSMVAINSQHCGVNFLQGVGVGVVTLPGLGLEIGDPAINQTPRTMIRNMVEEYLDISQVGVDITISVPNGQDIAKQTFNPRLGIINGISIIGTTGIVRPYSSETWIASIRKEMQVSKAVGVGHIVLNSGGRSEKYLRTYFEDLPSNAFIQYGNFIGQTLTFANELMFPKVTLGIMLGKAVKLAAGALDTHSHKVTMDKSFLKKVLLEAGEDIDVAPINLARELWKLVPDRDALFYQIILRKCYSHCSELVPNASLDILLMDDNGQFIKLK